MWKWKILKQAGVCLIIALTMLLVQSVNLPVLNKGSEIVMAQLSRNYSGSEVLTMARTGITSVAKAPATITNAVLSTNKANRYGQPIDQAEKGEVVPVYAVAAGTVTSVGENDQIGKFVKISHGDETASLYGNCRVVYAKELERIKKGQIIATYENDGKTEFYYSFSESQ